MPFSYPLQCSVATSDEKWLFFVLQSSILAFRQDEGKFKLAGKWTDSVTDSGESKEGVKRLKDNEGNAVQKADSPAIGAAFSLQIRNLTLTPDEFKLIACADSDKSILVFEIDHENDSSNCLKLVKRHPFPKRPNAIAIGEDSDTVTIADKFGDVHQMLISESKASHAEDVQPILGHVSMLTDVIMVKNSAGLKFIITSDRDEHIKISHYPQCFIVDKWLFGHKQFVSSLCCPSWNPSWLFSAGGDDEIFAWDWQKGIKLSQFNYAGLIKPFLTDAHLAAERFQNEEKNVIEYAASKVLPSSTQPCVAFFVEQTRVLVILDVCIKTGALILKQTIEFSTSIVSLSECHDEFIVTLDNREGDERSAEFVSYRAEDNLYFLDTPRSQSLDMAITAALKEDSSLGSNAPDLYPLYNTISVKKHGEHYS